MRSVAFPWIVGIAAVLSTALIASLLIKANSPATKKVTIIARTKHPPSTLSHRTKSKRSISSSPSSPSETGLIAHTMSSVVEIMATSSKGEDLGSGFVYNNQGDIMTNDHVISGATSVRVQTENGHVYSATIIGANPTLDVAVVNVHGLSLKPLTVNTQYGGVLGDNVLAFGSPLGLNNTVTTGIISGLNRHFTINGVHYQNMFQISAPIAPGNSGGPLVLLSTGAVIGMDTAGSTSSSGNIGFAISMGRVFPLAIQWAAHPQPHPVTLIP